MSAQAHRPRRSCLYMPGANTRALEKAKELAADTLIFDLEDAVAPEAKAEAQTRFSHQKLCRARTSTGWMRR